MSMMSPKPKGSGSGNGGSRTPTGKGRAMPMLQRQASRSGSHPVEVVGRIREHPEGNERESAIRVMSHSRVSVRADCGSREFSLDGVSLAAVEDLQAFYWRYVESRVDDVKAGGRCTIMMYGPTGAGKSYTMFGAAHEKGVAYHALSQLMTQRVSDSEGEDCGEGSIEVRATVWEIYNEEVYDLLASVAAPKSGFGTLFKMSGSSGGRVKLEMMGKKVKTCMSISGTDPQKLLKEISKVEGRRVVKSTNCNDRSSRSHCMVTIDVPEVGGKLILVDMAGSENIEQAGLGRELKMQTGKINQGNGALKRVVEAIANGDSYIPYRDSKLTMLLQDSFEDDRAKILMILCASPDLKDLHKTICTLEYGAKAKCIVRLPNSPSKEHVSTARAEQVQILEARLTKKDVYIEKLRKENEAKQRQNEERERELERKDRELAELRKKKRKGLHDGDDEDFNLSPTRRRKIEELTALVAQQQREIDLMRIRAEKAEAELLHLQRSYNLSSQAPARALTRTSSDGEDLGKQTACNQRFLDIQKQMTERILAAQAESEKIIAQYTPERPQNTQRTIKPKPQDPAPVPESTGAPSCEMMSLTANSPSLMMLKNLVKEKERRSSLAQGEVTHATESSVPEPEEDEEERLCSKGWLPIILEEDERIAQSMESRKSATSQGSGSGAKFEYSTPWAQVTPEGVGKGEEGAGGGAYYPSPEEQFNTAMASYTNISANGVGSPFSWGGSGSKLNDPSPNALMGPTPGSGFVSGELKDWTPQQEQQQLDRRLTASTLKTHSPLTALAESRPPMSDATELRDEQLGQPVSSMRSLEESPSEKVETDVCVGNQSSVMADLGVGVYDGSQSGGSDAEAARRARIESIFLLCGERRELTRKMTGTTPQADAGGRYSSLESQLTGVAAHWSHSSLESQQLTDFSTSPSFSDTYPTDVSVSSLPSLMPAVSPQRFPSSRRPTRRMSPSIFANENFQPKQELQASEKTEVYVKWEKSGDPADGKLICIANVAKTSTLSELREEVEADIPMSKRNFSFLFLGESGGAPVDREFEGDVRVGSLPASQENLGSRLACLRPPVPENGEQVSSRVESQQPFRALENQLSVASSPGKLIKGSPSKGLRPESGRPKSAFAHIVESSRCM